ncbi:MAG: sulfite exporter TauE/SafE family protein [Hyphomicrobiaceae bacterium]|nr:sulfite exporter TauE/SafE family protein [Hyphomicrobiaceae bacterium]
MPGTDTILLVGLTFLLAGAVKGVVGLGLPTVSLAVLTATLGLKPALALLIFPSLVTNAWQAYDGGQLRPLMTRLGPMLVAVCVGTLFGVGVLAVSKVVWLSLLFGVLLIVYAGSSLAGLRVAAPGSHEWWLSPAVGLVNGLLTGLTGSFVVPGVLYLQALQLPRDALVQAMGILFTVSTAILGVALGGARLMPADLAWLSLFAVLPALAGMRLGLMLRRQLSEAMFRRALFAALLVFGGYVAARSGLALIG